MSSDDLIREIEEHLQLSTRQAVVYLEGSTDVDIFFALLGRKNEGNLADGVYIRCLGGRKQVERRVKIGQERGYNVFGFTDGDGRDLDELARKFDAPHRGRLWCWKAYSIENLLLQVGWPWDPQADISTLLRVYSPYVAFNRLRMHIQDKLEQAELHKFINPEQERLWTVREMAESIRERQVDLINLDLVRDFEDEAEAFHQLVKADLPRAHTWINGKWFLSHLAPVQTGKTSNTCRREWLDYVIDRGGNADVKAAWNRLISGDSSL